MTKQIKKIPRCERKHSRVRVCSLNFLDNMKKIGDEEGRAFIPYSDFNSLLKKYEWLVRRRRKEIGRLNGY